MEFVVRPRSDLNDTSEIRNILGAALLRHTILNYNAFEDFLQVQILPDHSQLSGWQTPFVAFLVAFLVYSIATDLPYSSQFLDDPTEVRRGFAVVVSAAIVLVAALVTLGSNRHMLQTFFPWLLLAVRILSVMCTVFSLVYAVLFFRGGVRAPRRIHTSPQVPPFLHFFCMFFMGCVFLCVQYGVWKGRRQYVRFIDILARSAREIVVFLTLWIIVMQHVSDSCTNLSAALIAVGLLLRTTILGSAMLYLNVRALNRKDMYIFSRNRHTQFDVESSFYQLYIILYMVLIAPGIFWFTAAYNLIPLMYGILVHYHQFVIASSALIILLIVYVGEGYGFVYHLRYMRLIPSLVPRAVAAAALIPSLVPNAAATAAVIPSIPASISTGKQHPPRALVPAQRIGGVRIVGVPDRRARRRHV